MIELVEPPSRTSTLSWSWTWSLFIALFLALSFCYAFALPYFFEARILAEFGFDRRFALFWHIGGAGIALIVGPPQLWMGWTGRYLELHRKLGILYLISIAVGSISGLYLTATTQRGPVFAFGIGSLMVAWIVTTSLAYLAVLRRNFLQHREWMIRSYVVTFVFVSFRLIVMLLKACGVGSSAERIDIAIWLCWAGPLLLTETVIQGQKIFTTKQPARARLTRVPDEDGRSDLAFHSR